jgi:1-deoxy-D-xylulose-5-phosphate synthase
MTVVSYPLLESIDNPMRLRRLPEHKLLILAEELRSFLLQSVSQTGGHLASNLGVVELTIALHYVFNTPEDRLVWDVGHQSYAHKALTGRRKQMLGIRCHNGISGFPKRDESHYDSFGVGHSSTSISAALGMSLAAKQQGQRRKTVAIIGDGAMTAGMAFEALNHAGGMKADILVILNDNDMSISPNVGALSHYLGQILSSRLYTGVREGGKKFLDHLPGARELVSRTEEHLKGMLGPGTLFEELGFNYIGPVDGHNIHDLVRALRNVYYLPGPQFLHVITKKGKGFAPAEADPCSYHGVGSFDRKTGELHRKTDNTPTYTEIFSQWLCAMARQDPRLVGITPAMREGSGLVAFSEEFPQRYFDVGIAEQHAVTFAAGLACEGMKPVVAIYSTFLQRAYDQLIHDVALQNLPVLFAIDRAGLVGADGPTHAGSFDLSYLRCIPNILIMAPADERECWHMLNTGFLHDGPAAVRYPRGSGAGATIDPTELSPFAIGRAEIRQQGHNIALLAFGSLLQAALEAGKFLNATVVNMRFVKPLDSALLLELAKNYSLLVTLEENSVAGGAGSAVNEFLQQHACVVPCLNLGLPDHFVKHGNTEKLLAECGLDSTNIIQAIQARQAQLNATTIQ